MGRGAAGLAADDLLDTVWFRGAERAVLYRKAILAGSRMSVETVKQRALRWLTTEAAVCPADPPQAPRGLGKATAHHSVRRSVFIWYSIFLK